jgi:ATPase subunit of ABC transporter with duplicated ATPase domains
MAAAIKQQVTDLSTVKWTDLKSIQSTFPSWMQEKIALEDAKAKNVTNKIEIPNFTMMTPIRDKTLLKNTELCIEANKKSCVYGMNGVGKTLLFHYMATGEFTPMVKDFPKHIFVYHCKELEHKENEDTVFNTIINAHPLRNALVAAESKLTALVAAETDEETKETLEENLKYVQLQMRSIGGYNAEDKIRSMLRVLGFDAESEKRNTKDLSGGLRMRVALCMAFFIEADLLLLDEPTNHLDFPSVLWLEHRLRAYRKSFLVVTHDRELLENCTSQVLVIEDQKIQYFNVNFKQFEKLKAKQDKKKFDDIEKFLVKHRNVDFSTPMGRTKADYQAWSNKYYQKQVMLAGKFTFPKPAPLKALEQDEEGNDLPESQTSLVKLNKVRFSYRPEEGNFIFNTPISFNVQWSTRVGVLGPNGAGKSTLLKLITKKLTPTEGGVTDHPDYQLAYFGQHSTAELDMQLTANEFMQLQFPDVKAGILTNHLAKTGIVGDVSSTRMIDLTYSQRSCIIFAKLTYVPPHLLIMDEPTNFLDLDSVDALITAANKYTGALLLVSHNRNFLKKTCTHFLSIVPGKFALFDNLKEAERATYDFIAIMEAGKALDAENLVSGDAHGTGAANQGGAFDGNIVIKQKVEEVAEEVVDKNAPKVKKVVKSYVFTPVTADDIKVGDMCEAKYFADRKFYSAKVTKAKFDTKNGNKVYKKIDVLFLKYGNTETVTAADMKNMKRPPTGYWEAKAAQAEAEKAAKAKGGAKGGNRNNTKKTGQQQKAGGQQRQAGRR